MRNSFVSFIIFILFASIVLISIEENKNEIDFGFKVNDVSYIYRDTLKAYKTYNGSPANLKELEDNSTYILRVRVNEEYSQLQFVQEGYCNEKVDVLEVYKGEGIKVDSTIEIDSNLYFKLDKKNELLYIEPFFKYMEEHEEYVVFLNDSDKKETYKYSSVEVARLPLLDDSDLEMHLNRVGSYERSFFETKQDYEQYIKYLDAYSIILKSSIDKYYPKD